MTDWHIGMRVVCVDDSRSRTTGRPCPFRKGSIYEIEAVAGGGDVFICPFCSEKVEIGADSVALIGVDQCDRRNCRYWHASRFRPHRKTKTDISIFRKLIEPSELAKFKESIEA